MKLSYQSDGITRQLTTSSVVHLFGDTESTVNILGYCGEFLLLHLRLRQPDSMFLPCTRHQCMQFLPPWHLPPCPLYFKALVGGTQVGAPTWLFQSPSGTRISVVVCWLQFPSLWGSWKYRCHLSPYIVTCYLTREQYFGKRSNITRENKNQSRGNPQKCCPCLENCMYS